MGTESEERERNRRIRVSPKTHRALKAARVGDMTLDDVIQDALREYEPHSPADPVDILGEA
jgi:hypothetical protein